MSSLYEPNGRAREYSPLAFNYHAGLCANRCKYCYAASIVRGQAPVINRDKVLSDLEKSVRKTKPAQVLLNFLHDPYEPICRDITPEVVRILAAAGFPIAILTKCISHAMKDLNLFLAVPALKIGTTLTCDNDKDAREWEPGADSISQRLGALQTFYSKGIKTFISFEPVIFPLQTLKLMEATTEFVNEMKIGRWNHSTEANKIDFNSFGRAAIKFTRFVDQTAYFKDDLRAAMQGFEFLPQESDYRLHELKPIPQIERSLFS